MSVKLKCIAKIIFIASIVVAASSYAFFSRNATGLHTIGVAQAKTFKESQVIRVIDGDTIVVSVHQKPETIRLIGIDTPETVDPKKPVRCYGPEASKETKKRLMGKIVRLESDPSQGNRDAYHRLLRYVFLDDQNVNASLIINGFAREYTFMKPYKYQKEFRADEKTAKKNNLGLWKKCK